MILLVAGVLLGAVGAVGAFAHYLRQAVLR